MLYDVTDGDCFKIMLFSIYINSKSKNIRYSQFYYKLKRLHISLGAVNLTENELAASLQTSFALLFGKY